MSGTIGVDLSCAPDPFGTLAIRGPDAAKFLQGQLSADLENLAPGASTLAGLHNPQGRVIALLGLVRATSDEFFAALPGELAATVAGLMRKYILRSKVKIEDLSDSRRVVGAMQGAAAPSAPAIQWGARRLLLLPREEDVPLSAGAADHDRWNQADVAAGLPQVYAATSGSFVSQMLNLDLLGAISFEKGCYTGQEVIARAHYRGRVKRRLQRWHNASGTALKPGDTARSNEGQALTVVRVTHLWQGRQELLAIGTYGPTEAADPDASADSAAIRVSGPLSLPYALP
jgi:folate-binding protein YgfZ